ncbi:MAG TPA: class I SAM-dependent methyltransferase [Solirubrobacterales bacterium]|jgi:SAM-dependent methyltransferase
MEATTADSRGDWALNTYQAMAPVYDDFTAHHDYEGWLVDLLKILELNGLAGKRLLDVACGTGKSFLPMLPRGWQVTGCDLSPAMLALAEEKVGDSVGLSVADMRELPKLGEFDLVWALDDAINYLLSPEELEQAFRGMRDNLAATGLLLFDVNELLVYRTFYAETSVVEQGGKRFVWRGLAPAGVPAGSVCESRLEVEGEEGAGVAEGETAIHRQRHFPEAEVLAALERAGLECLDIYGHGLDGIPKQPLDTAQHTKAIYIARRADT